MFYRTAGPSATGSAAGSEPPVAPAGMLVTPVQAVACPSGSRRAGGSALVCGPAGGGGLASGDQVVLWHPVAVAPVKVKCTAPGLVETRFSLLADLVVL